MQPKNLELAAEIENLATMLDEQGDLFWEWLELEKKEHDLKRKIKWQRAKVNRMWGRL